MADQVCQKVIITMVDAAGKTGTTSTYVATDAGTNPADGVGDLVVGLNAASNAVVKRIVGQTANNTPVGSKSANTYDIRDKLAVEYVGSQNDHHVIHVGDPDPDIFDADNGETVDITNSAWLAAKSAIQSNVKDKLGNAVTVIRGYRTRSNKLKTTLKFQ